MLAVIDGAKALTSAVHAVFDLALQRPGEPVKIADVAVQLTGTGAARILSTRGSVIAEPRTNQLFVTDVPTKLEQVQQLIGRIDIPVRQVLIEARIVEASDTFGKSLGVRLGGSDLRGVRGGDAGYSLGGGNRIAFGGSYNAVSSTTTESENTLDTINTSFVNLPSAGVGGPADVLLERHELIGREITDVLSAAQEKGAPPGAAEAPCAATRRTWKRRSRASVIRCPKSSRTTSSERTAAFSSSFRKRAARGTRGKPAGQPAQEQRWRPSFEEFSQAEDATPAA